MVLVSFPNPSHPPASASLLKVSTEAGSVQCLLGDASELAGCFSILLRNGCPWRTLQISMCAHKCGLGYFDFFILCLLKVFF
jgi:hypothetical protein